MIEKLTLQNFKVLRDVEVELRPLTVIVGPNGSGKSSILEALDLLLQHYRKSDESGSAEDLDVFRSRLSDEPAGVECRGRHLGRELTLTLGIHKGGFFTFRGRLGGERFRTDQERLDLSSVLLKLEVRQLAAPSYPKQISLVLPEDGEGLSSVLAGLYLEDVARFEDLVEQLKKVIPGVKNLHVRRAPVDKNRVGYELAFDMQGAEEIPAYTVSDGTLLTLGLLTVLAVPSPPQLVLIDDLERGFHPRALGDLVQQLRRIQEQNSELQIVATSHSPYLLDFVEAEEVLLTSLDEDGYAAVRPLTDHPEYERWKGLMAPGEFWSMVGESWITKKETESAKAE